CELEAGLGGDGSSRGLGSGHAEGPDRGRAGQREAGGDVAGLAAPKDSAVKASPGRPGQGSPSVSVKGVAGPSGVHRVQDDPPGGGDRQAASSFRRDGQPAVHGAPGSTGSVPGALSPRWG